MDNYQVIRVSGEITVGLIARACDITCESAKANVVIDEIQGVKIPYLAPGMLIKTKMGVRPKDVQDRKFLENLLKQRNSNNN